ncbi:histidine phosphatase family protein [Gilliamella apicola]|uniref:Multiple inositol polyphosphate phosphatase 1 n=1 Tax=Gilliamella apicola TaxID=1196095 RepID=A0A556RFE5_9GAMM|nr:histidine-type phosphatase [Gilliamella apicola]TSJ87623.1 histidine phosphatase family protein [Gilliamella apicola]
MSFIKQSFFIQFLIVAILLLIFSPLSLATMMTSGSKTAYQYVKQPTAVPAGYQAFYIDHIGRHGSRYLSKSKYEDIAYSVLTLAEKNNQLTDMGKSLLKQITRINALNRNHYGELTDLGRKDISLISQRMLNNYPTVFKGQKIEVISSTSPRAKETAEIFVKPFKANYPDIHIFQPPENKQTLLRFFEYSPAYDGYKKSKNIKAALKSLERATKTADMSQDVARLIFTADFIHQLNNGVALSEKSSIKTADFVIAIYQLYQELLSFSPETLAGNHLDFSDYFTQDQLVWFNTVVTAKNFLQIGPAFDVKGIQVKIAAPLLLDMLKTADKAITDKNVDANLRFAHAETVSPLATLLELEGAYTAVNSVEDYPSVWQAERIIPMGANIQWIFYQSNQPNQPILIKVMLNEREVHLPLPTNNFPYYQWDAVKQYYKNKLHKLGLTDESDSLEWLNKVK